MPDIPILTDIDPTRMRQVVANLMDNALKHTSSGSIWIKVSIDGENVTLKVEDTGQGIAPDFLPHIFNLFTQTEAEGEGSRGLGIGLSLTRDIVLLHKGSIQATSDGLGKGSIFIVSFPQRSSAVSL